jgi:hypothetical protein
MSDKAWTASVLNGLKNDPSDEFIGVQVILKNKRCLSGKNES